MNMPLCSALSFANGEVLNGSAPTHRRYLFLEIPPPWPYQAKDASTISPDLQQVLTDAGEAPIRIQAFFSEEHAAPDGFRRMFYFYLPNQPNMDFIKCEYVIPENQSADLTEAIINLEGDAEPEQLAAYQVKHSEEIEEWFVCTHGSRDFCCGKIGVPLYMQFKDAAQSANGRIRVWRTDHLGGHRFAPTAVSFPDGRYWGRLEHDQLDALIHKKGSFAHLTPSYRGWSGFGKLEQLAETEILKNYGWKMTEKYKTAKVISSSSSQSVVQIAYYDDIDGGDARTPAEVYEAVIAQDGEAETFSCTGGSKKMPRYKVTQIIKK